MHIEILGGKWSPEIQKFLMNNPTFTWEQCASLMRKRINACDTRLKEARAKLKQRPIIDDKIDIDGIGTSIKTILAELIQLHRKNQKDREEEKKILQTIVDALKANENKKLLEEIRDAQAKELEMAQQQTNIIIEIRDFQNQSNAKLLEVSDNIEKVSTGVDKLLSSLHLVDNNLTKAVEKIEGEAKLNEEQSKTLEKISSLQDQQQGMLTDLVASYSSRQNNTEMMNLLSKLANVEQARDEQENNRTQMWMELIRNFDAKMVITKILEQVVRIRISGEGFLMNQTRTLNRIESNQADQMEKHKELMSAAQKSFEVLQKQDENNYRDLKETLTAVNFEMNDPNLSNILNNILNEQNQTKQMVQMASENYVTKLNLSLNSNNLEHMEKSISEAKKLERDLIKEFYNGYENLVNIFSKTPFCKMAYPNSLDYPQPNQWLGQPMFQGPNMNLKPSRPIPEPKKAASPAPTTKGPKSKK